jgi:hypothetical protein
MLSEGEEEWESVGNKAKYEETNGVPKIGGLIIDIDLNNLEGEAADTLKDVVD